VVLHFKENIKEWLTCILPNLKEFIYCYTSKFVPIRNEKIERLKINDVASIYGDIKTNDVYFPNVKHIELQLTHFGPYDVMKVLKSFKNLKTLMVYFKKSSDCYGNIVEFDLHSRFDKLNLIELLENYQIKHTYNCYQFIKKTNSIDFI
jgi:hypothetical protein